MKVSSEDYVEAQEISRKIIKEADGECDKKFVPDIEEEGSMQKTQIGARAGSAA